MPDETEEELERRHDEIVAGLRAQFLPLADRLTADVEPATVYSAHDDK